jgi:hypothetical protein
VAECTRQVDETQRCAAARAADSSRQRRQRVGAQRVAGGGINPRQIKALNTAKKRCES